MNQLVERAVREGAPVVERTKAIFVWIGDHAPCLVGDFNNWRKEEALQFLQVEEGVWKAEIELLEDAYIEYVFWDNKKRIIDPLNKNKVRNLDGYNSYFYMPGGGKTPLATRMPKVAKGTVTCTRISTSANFMSHLAAGNMRKVYFYQPQTDQPVPLLVVYDGKETLRRLNLPTILDNLIAQRRIQPIALAMIENGGWARTLEYLTSEATLGFIQRIVLPEARERLDLLDINKNPGAYGVCGASMGGLMALYTGLRAPHIFGKVLAQSGAFSFGEYDTLVWDLIKLQEKLPLRIWLDVGKYEWLLECNRKLYGLLKSKDYEVEYHEFSGYHNIPMWRDDIWRGLQFLFCLK